MKWKQYMEKADWGKCRRGAATALNCLLIFLMVSVITAGAGYTVLLGDDFTHGVRVGVFHASLPRYFAASLQYMKEIYLDWQGTYFAMFIQAFLSPINNFGMGQLRAVMMGNALFFFGALLLLVWNVLGFALQERKMLHLRLTVFTLVLFGVLNGQIFTEIFFWFSGATAYGIPFSVMLLSVSFFLMANRAGVTKRKKFVFTAVSAVTLFLASGGSLTVTGTGCYLAVLLSLGFYLASGRISWGNLCITAAGIAGALINAAAPGNFSRHTETAGESLLLLKAMKWSVKNVLAETQRLAESPFFAVLILSMIFVGIYLSGKLGEKLAAYTFVSVLSLFTGIVTAFPVAVGYSGPYFPNRCCFILDVVLGVTLFNLAVLTGCVLDRWGGLRENRSACAVLAVVLLTAVLLSPASLADSPVMTVSRSLRSGSYSEYYEACTALYDYLENCEETDVVLEMPEYIENFECFYLDEDENAWVNQGLAQYYHKDSVKRKAE